MINEVSPAEIMNGGHEMKGELLIVRASEGGHDPGCFLMADNSLEPGTGRV